MKSENGLPEETFIDKFVRYNKEFDTSFYMFCSFVTLNLILIGLFALVLMKVATKDTVLTSEVVHLVLMGAFGLVNSVGSFLFGKKLGEVNGNGSQNKEAIREKIAEVNRIISDTKEKLEQ